MTPKQKAEQLVDQFDEYAEARISDSGRGFDKKYCTKQCALIAVDELIEHTDWTEVNYWQEVKQEIQNI